MFNYKIFIDDIYNVISQKHTFFELLLNITFVLIIFLLIFIFYWDSINRSIIKKNRCKIHINNEDKTYNIKVISKDENKKLVNISYDSTKDHNIKIDCLCPAGNVVNNFENIEYYNYNDNKFKQMEKICKCDNDYKTNEFNYIGDEFLVDFYNTRNKDNTRLEFPN